MWILGVGLLLILVMLMELGLGRLLGAEPSDSDWEVPRITSTFTTIVGALAGFTVTSAIFIANLSVARESAAFQDLIGIFLLAFIIFTGVGAAQEVGSPPIHSATAEGSVLKPRLVYLLAMFGYFVGLAISWINIRLLLLAIDLRFVADVFTWVLLFALLGATNRLALQYCYRLTAMPFVACLTVPPLGFLAAVGYRLGLAERFPSLQPPGNEPFLFAVVCFGVAAAALALHSVVLTVRPGPMERLVFRYGELAVFLLLAAISTAVPLLWLSVANA